MSVVKGLIPWACSSLAKRPMIKLPVISKTDPLVTACLTCSPSLGLPRVALNSAMSNTPTTIEGASIRAITATIWPPNAMCSISKNEMAVTKVTALTEP